MQLRKIPLHQSLIRPILLAGAERNLAMLNGVIAAALVFGVGSLWAVGLGILFAVVVHALLVRLAKRDHQFFDVYRRHITYQEYYPARALVGAPEPIIKYWEPC
jgi:type IV secretion system protein VirB3